MKRLLATLLSAALLATGAAAADVDTDSAPVQAEQAPAQMAERVLQYGTIVSLTQEDETYTLLMDRPESGQLQINANADTLLLNDATDTAGAWDDLQTGDSVYVYCAPYETMSIPPQTSAQAIVYQVPADAGCPKMHRIEQVETTEDGGVRLLTDSGSLWLSADVNTNLLSYATKQTVGLDDLQVDTRIFAWYDVVLESYPGQAFASQLMVLPTSTEAYDIVLEEDMVLPAQAVWQDEVLTVPLRAVAETLGCTVGWDDTHKSATVTNGQTSMTVALGQDAYQTQAGTQAALGCAPYLDAEGSLWIPAQAFTSLGFQVLQMNGVVEIGPAA